MNFPRDNLGLNYRIAILMQNNLQDKHKEKYIIKQLEELESHK